MTLEKRIEKLESVSNPKKLPEIEITFVSCSHHVNNPELFRKVPNDIEVAGIKTFTMEPIDPDFKCELYCCKDR